MTCTDCPLHISAITNCMPGRGSASASIMLVGQGPGAQEDLNGEPFVGKSGKILDAMLADSSYDLNDVYFTNATRCRPPIVNRKERAPEPSEVEACRKYLIADVQRVRPKAIIALGDVALRALTGKTGIKSWRGKSLPLHEAFGFDAEVWPTYHPAYVARVPVARNVVLADLRRVRDRAMPQVEVPWVRVTDHSEPWRIDSQRPMALDIETVDADGTFVDRPTQIAIAEHDGIAATVIGERALTNCKGFSGRPLVTHNGWRFDIPLLRKHGIEVPWGRDTLVMAYLEDETQPLNLEALAVRYLGVRGWKEDRDAPLGSDTFAGYNARDAAYTLRLYSELLSRLGRRVKIADQIILPGYLALQEAAARGIWIDGNEVAHVRADVDAQLDKTLARLREITGNPEFNPNANAQVAEYLIAHGFVLPPTKQSGKPSTDKATIEACIEESDLPETTEFLTTFKAYKRVRVKRSTYVIPYENAAASDDHRMHNEYTVWNTKVGRTSARRSNVQNLDRELKSFMSAPPGAVWAEGDYNALHIRLAAFDAREQTIISRYQADSKWDPHVFFAQQFYGLSAEEIIADHAARKHIGDSKRQIAKSANFSQLYIGQEETLIHYAAQFGIFLTWDEAHRIHVAWHQSFPGFKPWYVRTWEELKAYGYVETATGRRRHFGDVSMLNKIGAQEALREAVNFKVLGLEPDVALLGLSACRDAGLPINYFGHDAIRFEFANAREYHDSVELIRRCMVDEPLRILREEFGVTIDVPLEIEITSNCKE